MAIDHGLGGRDGEKSKKRREKKAKRTKMIARKALQRTKDGKKTEIVFDEKARVDYVANFHKRKQDRRRYGLAMEVFDPILYFIINLVACNCCAKIRSPF